MDRRWTQTKDGMHRLDGGAVADGVSMEVRDGRVAVYGMEGRFFGSHLKDVAFDVRGSVFTLAMPFDEARDIVTRAHDDLAPRPRRPGVHKAIVADGAPGMPPGVYQVSRDGLEQSARTA